LYIYAKNRTNGKWQLPTVCYKRKMETANIRFFSANGNKNRSLLSLGGLETIDGI
jgi:hypothetical protein